MIGRFVIVFGQTIVCAIKQSVDRQTKQRTPRILSLLAD